MRNGIIMLLQTAGYVTTCVLGGIIGVNIIKKISDRNNKNGF